MCVMGHKPAAMAEIEFSLQRICYCLATVQVFALTEFYKGITNHTKSKWCHDRTGKKGQKNHIVMLNSCVQKLQDWLGYINTVSINPKSEVLHVCNAKVDDKLLVII